MTKTQRFPPSVAGDFVRRSERETEARLGRCFFLFLFLFFYTEKNAATNKLETELQETNRKRVVSSDRRGQEKRNRRSENTFKSEI